jgi:hypothetical protein
MNPEFLLRFLSIAPSGVEVKKTYRNIFPTILGIRLAHRVESDTLKEVLKKLDDAQNLEPEARLAKISLLSDELKTRNFRKQVEKESLSVSTDNSQMKRKRKRGNTPVRKQSSD